jgi:thymidylate synthase ThyX
LAYLNKAEELYRELIDSGIKPEFARDVLPGCLATTIIVTMNLREWRYVLKLRTSKFAHPDMQKLMKQLLYELKEYLPLIFNDIQGIVTISELSKQPQQLAVEKGIFVIEMKTILQKTNIPELHSLLLRTSRGL